MNVRNANDEDLLKLLSWFSTESEVKNWGGPLIHFPLTLNQLKIDIEWSVASSYAFVGQNSDLIGFAQVFNKYGFRHLGRIVISPEMRGKKLGAKLMESLLDSVSESDSSFSLFVYDKNIPAKRLYERLGFEERTYPEGRHEIKGCSFMVKT
ncbi:GNAT family N-acetyltransferase [Shewanella sp.]|uniref:GNAT family N-acetyltransferase n=1 Tax=Shewanella sp. TaxID=50422 RepID=UPI00404872F1